jgi:hypothetical protein
MTKQERVQSWIGTMSYYNAAEGNYSSEASARKDFKDTMASEVKTWGITKSDFLNLYNSCSKHLTVASDFTYPLCKREAFTDSE